MSALEELDRYIQQHEVTLQSISKQKLTRKPPHKAERSLINVTNASQFDISMGFQPQRPSIDSELQSLIMRLKQVQQSRLSQLQQANALFMHEMNIEDQFNMQIRTDDEHNKALAEEEFEAFLLGESNPATSTSASAMESAPTQTMTTAHQTLFTKKSLSTTHPSSQSIRPPSTGTSDNTQSSETKPEHENEELSTSFTDDVMLNLQRSRLDRTQRLRNIATSIQCMTAQSSKYPVSTFKSDVLDLSTLPPPPPPLAEPPALPQSHIAYSSHTKSAPSYTYNPADTYRSTCREDTVSGDIVQEEAITQQSILEDEQFSVAPAQHTTAHANTTITNTATNTNAMNVTTNNDNYINLHDATNIAPTHTTSNVPTTHYPATHITDAYLKSNRTRKALEQELVDHAKHNLDISAIHPHNAHTNPAHTTTTGNTTNTNSDKHNKHKPVPRSPTARTINFNTGTDSVHGIGYGSRYKHNTDHHANTVDNSTNSIQLEWDESSVGSGDSGTDEPYIHHTHNTHHTHTKKTNTNTNAKMHSSSGIFEYADALESPGTKSGAHKHHNQHTSTNTTTTNANSRHVVFADPADAPILHKSTTVESKVSEYYQRRMYRLEHGTSPPPATPHTTDTASTYNTKTTSTSSAVVPNYEAYSPERKPISAHSYDSPLPKTPTFPPIFS